MSGRSKGKAGEDAAVDYLLKKGYRILDRNFRFDRGEIDIVAEDGDVLVFIEVKARSTHAFGEPEEAVTPRKRAQIVKTAEGYLFSRSIEDRECRFDVVAIDLGGEGMNIRHLVEAF